MNQCGKRKIVSPAGWRPGANLKADLAGSKTGNLRRRLSAAEHSRPAGLCLDRHEIGAGDADTGHGTEESVLPLADGVGDVLQLTAQVDLTDQGF